MRLKSLRIQGYKNIQDLKIGFEDKEGITLLIGNNGTGKSNIIEAVASIFAGLYENRIHKPTFDYDVTYEINFTKVSISLHAGEYTIHVNDEEMTKTAFQLRAKEFLPENVVACYSGESLRLFEHYFQPYYKRYVDTLKKEDGIPVLPMIYVNKYNIKIALLTLFFCKWEENEDVKRFCMETLHIKRLTKVVFHYNNKIILAWPENAVVKMIKQINAIGGVGAISPDTCTYKDMEELKAHLHYLDERMFFKYMYAATMPLDNKAIKDIEIEMELDNGVVISIEELSEGEKKYLLIKTILEVISTENSIILFDEPDAHIHISRKAELKTQLLPYNNRETIITTHSPTLAMCFDNSHLQGLGKNANGYTTSISRDKVDLISQITDGLWSAQELNAFLASNKPISLLVEGKTDKIHLEEAFVHLKSNYPNLDFDVYYFSGADNIPQFVKGLNTCNIDLVHRKIIAIFDNDAEGKDCCNKTTVKFDGSKNKKGMYAITLPITNTTIENYYAKELFADTYFQVAKTGDFSGLITKENERILKQAKIKFSELVQQANDPTIFIGFKPIFDIIDQIRKL